MSQPILHNGSRFKVHHYMSTRVATLVENATFRDAVETMIREKTNGLVIVDDHKKVVGILSGWDLIEHIVPDYLERDKHLAAFESGDIFDTRAKEIADHPVSQFMTRQVKTVSADDTLMEAATLLSEHKIRQLPVVDQSGILLGYINRTDIKRAIADALGL